MNDLLEATRSILKVGDSRGFVVNGERDRLVITAAHCLPRFPPCHAASYLEERTYAALLGVLGRKKPTVWAECLFVDPVADIAVLGPPDDQELSDEYDEYERLLEEHIPLSIADLQTRLLGCCRSMANGSRAGSVTTVASHNHVLTFG